jgi:phage tail sheath protein FI
MSSAGGDNTQITVATKLGAVAGPTLSANAIVNTRYYSLGTTGSGPYQTAGTPGNNGIAPEAADYEAAYQIIDREVDLFNLMVLPKDADHSEATTRKLWGPASVFCQKRRAFLVMDPPSDWTDSQKAIDASVGVNTLRVGLVKDHSAVFYPRLKIDENGKEVYVGPSGAVAGLMARIDGTRGVWKAPAGTEADLRGIIGVERRFSDGENGVMNPKAVNTIRVFPNGIVNWGARTMDGDDGFASEYKYIPIRRLALFLEESLYRGLKWAVFEPNDEPLWAQIRLNVGAFMHTQFRQGAFQGATPREAYFVKCDASTTTQNDRNLGIVNIVVGFAPLKPAEFVVLYLQQIAGQIQT